MDAEIARWRLRTQRLTAPHAGSTTEVFETLLAVQAENPSQSAWAVAARTGLPDAADLDTLLSSGAVVRTHVLRPTWHYVARTDVDWLLALTAPRVAPTVTNQLTRDLGLTAEEIDTLGVAVLQLLGEEPDRTRDEVIAALPDRVPGLGERVTGRLVMLLMAMLELDRQVCSGRPRAGEHTYAAYDDRVGERIDGECFDRDAALARVALRYFSGHGPATVKDLAYWATLTVTDVRRGLDAVREHLVSFEHDGRTYWHAPGAAPDGPGRPEGHLLQLLDEMYRGYQDSRWVVDADGVVPRERERSIGMALVDGQLVAGMRRTVTPTRVRFELTPHRPLSTGERAVLAQAADRYGAFLGRDAELVVVGGER